jgi:hypothetical protein
MIPEYIDSLDIDRTRLMFGLLEVLDPRYETKQSVSIRLYNGINLQCTCSNLTFKFIALGLSADAHVNTPRLQLLYDKTELEN